MHERGPSDLTEVALTGIRWDGHAIGCRGYLARTVET